MEKLETMRWKYLRESDVKYFDPNRNTPLKEYLSYIFNGYDFVYNSNVPKDVVFNRNKDAKLRRYKPDARCEELNLIVEFDGIAHYQDPQVVLNDRERDDYFESLGYIVVRIPYWIQLSNEVIYHLFSKVSEYITIGDDPMCTLDCSFHDIDKEDFNISISVGAMCAIGQARFVDEVSSLPISTQISVYYDILWCCEDAIMHDISPEYVMPNHVMQSWGIDYTIIDNMLPENCNLDCAMERINYRENSLFFGEDFSSMNYACCGVRNFYINYTIYNDVKEHGYFGSEPKISKSLHDSLVKFIDTVHNKCDRFTVCGVSILPFGSSDECCETYVTGCIMYLNFDNTSTDNDVAEFEHICKSYIDSEELHIHRSTLQSENVILIHT